MAIDKARLEAACGFLADLWGADLPDDSYLTMWGHGARILQYRDLDEAARAIASNKLAYVNVAALHKMEPARVRAYERGAETDALALPGFGMDFDTLAGAAAHAAKNLPTDEEGIALLSGLPNPPTVIVHSGGGLYAWWLFREPWVFESDEERLQAAALSKGWQLFVIAQAKARGWQIDNTADLARVLRFPGSENRKPEYGEPRPVRVLSRNEQRWNPSDFEQWVLPEDCPNEEAVERVQYEAGEFPTAEINDALSCIPPDTDYSIWLRIGLALHSTGSGLSAFDCWDTWSSRATRKCGSNNKPVYPGRSALHKRWSSFGKRRSGPTVGLGSLVFLARAHGWTGSLPRPQAEEQKKDPRPEIDLLAGELPKAADRAERELLNPAAPTIYQRQGALVRTVRLERPQEGRIEVEAGAIVIREVLVDFLLDRLARAIRFFRFNKEGERIRCHPPAELARIILSHAGSWPFPVLTAVVEAPQLFGDGRIVDVPGYDVQSGILFNPQGAKFLEIPANLTRDDALRSLTVLDELLAGFAFVDACDRSAALAMLLSGVGRSVYGAGPAFGASAPNRASGKSTLIRLAAILATGRAPAVIAPGCSEEEADKRILSILQDGHRFVCFDNLQSGDELDVPSIAKAITESTYTGRVLGKTGTMSFPTDGVHWTYGGVNIAPRGDTVSRTLLIRLDLQEERPWAHKWTTPDPCTVARQRRAEFVAAALAVLRAFLNAGCPDQGLEPCRFPEWSRVVRQALVWLGRPDPMAGMSELEASDPESESLAELMHVWWRVFANTPVTTAQVLQANQIDDLRAVIQAVASNPRTGDPAAARLGRFLKRYVGRIVDGMRFVRVGDSGTRALWALETRTSAPSAPSPSTPCGKTDSENERVCAHAHARTHVKGAGERCKRCEGANEVDAPPPLEAAPVAVPATPAAESEPTKSVESKWGSI